MKTLSAEYVDCVAKLMCLVPPKGQSIERCPFTENNSGVILTLLTCNQFLRTRLEKMCCIDFDQVVDDPVKV